MEIRIRAIQSTLANCKSNSEKNISTASNSPTTIPRQTLNSAEIARNNFANGNNQGQDSNRPIIVANSISNGIGGQQGKGFATGENNSSSSNSTSFSGLTNLNYNPDLNASQKIYPKKRVVHSSTNPGRESFRQGRNVGAIPPAGNGGTETGASISSGVLIKDSNSHTSLNIDKSSHSSKGPIRR